MELTWAWPRDPELGLTRDLRMVTLAKRWPRMESVNLTVVTQREQVSARLVAI